MDHGILLSTSASDGTSARWSVAWHQWLWALDTATPPRMLLHALLQLVAAQVPHVPAAFPGHRLPASLHALSQWVMAPCAAQAGAVRAHTPFLARHAAPLAVPLYWATCAVAAYPPPAREAVPPTTALWSSRQDPALSPWSAAMRRAITELGTLMATTLHRQPGIRWATAHRRSTTDLQERLVTLCLSQVGGAAPPDPATW